MIITYFPTIEDIPVGGQSQFKPTGTAGTLQDVLIEDSPLHSRFQGDIYTSRGMFGNGTSFIEIGAEDMRSNNFVSGSTGWKIEYNGDVEFADGTFRGTITATAGTIGGWSIDSTRIYTDVMELNSSTNGGLIRFKEAGVTKVDSYWDVSSHYWGVFPSFGGYAYAGIGMSVADNRLAFAHPGNSPYIQMAFFTKQITVNCDETTSQVDFYILPNEIRLSRDYIDIG